MASKLKNRQKAEVARALAAESNAEHQSTQPDRRSSTANEEGDEFQAPANIASKIAQRRLPRRTPTSHVRGVGGEMIRRRLSKTAETGALTGNVANKRLTFEASIEKSIDEQSQKPPLSPRQKTFESPETSKLSAYTKPTAS